MYQVSKSQGLYEHCATFDVRRLHRVLRLGTYGARGTVRVSSLLT